MVIFIRAIHDDQVTVDEVVTSIQRLDSSNRLFNRESEESQKKVHTMGSRWSLVKSAMSMQPVRRKSSIYTGYTHTGDFQRYKDFHYVRIVSAINLFFNRIQDQWINHCTLQGTPLTEISKITSEFKKRINREGTHDAKEKLNLSGCELNDQQVSIYCSCLVIA